LAIGQVGDGRMQAFFSEERHPVEAFFTQISRILYAKVD
jgi:hypothetical protein